MAPLAVPFPSKTILLSLDPGRPLPGLEVTGLLPLYLSWISRDTAGYKMELS